MDASSIEKDENIWKDLGFTSVREQIEEKVTDFMAENELSDLTWTGRWFSTEEINYRRNIYAQFQRRQNQFQKYSVPFGKYTIL